MEVKTVCILCVLACTLLVSCVTSFPTQETEDAVDVPPAMSHGENALDALTGGTAEEMERSRRIVGGIPRKVGNSYRGGRRPPLYRPQWRPRYRSRGRGGYSPY